MVDDSSNSNNGAIHSRIINCFSQGLSYLASIFIFFIVIFDPQNALGFRQKFLILGSFLSVFLLFKLLRNFKKNVWLIYSVYFIQFWGILVYFLRIDHLTFIKDSSYISFTFAFGYLYFFDNIRERIVIKSMTFVSSIFSIIVILSALSLFNQNNTQILDFFISNDIARISFREYSGFEIPYIYFYSSTFILLPISFYCSRERLSVTNFLLLIICLSALLLSGTRSHIVLSIFFFLYYLLKITDFKKYKSLLYFSIISALIFTSVGQSFLSTTEDSNAYKLGMISVYSKMIFNPDFTWLLGQGFESFKWSFDLRSIIEYQDGATKAELTYLEILRVFGLPVGGLLLLLTTYQWFVFSRMGVFHKLGFGALLFDAVLNPHLFSTYGAIYIVILFSIKAL
jgi:hypothetical protein